MPTSFRTLHGPGAFDSRRGRHKQLLKDPDVRRWNENLARGSHATADNFLRILGLFLEVNGLTPAMFAKMGTKKRDDLLSDHIAKMQRDGKAGSYAAVVKKAAAALHKGRRPHTHFEQLPAGARLSPLPFLGPGLN